MDEWRLRVGTRLTGFVVRPDAKWAGMWRIHAPDGRVSDMVNLSRAKDGAMAQAIRMLGLGGTGIKALKWHMPESGQEGALVRQTEPRLPEPV